jgi:hypothetical protein
MWLFVVAAAWSSEPPAWKVEVHGFGEESVPEWTGPWAERVAEHLHTCIEPDQQPGWISVRLTAEPPSNVVLAFVQGDDATREIASCVAAPGKVEVPSTEAREAQVRVVIHTGTVPPEPSLEALPWPPRINIDDLIGGKGIQLGG